MNISFSFEESCAPHRIVLTKRKYRFEAWGAQGGGDPLYSGKGGYTSGTIILRKITKIFVYVGGKGKNGEKNRLRASGGCNGGGNGGLSHNETFFGGSGGGGATDFRLSTSYKSRILVSGGGGGNGGFSHSYGRIGGGISTVDTIFDNVRIGASQSFGNEEGIGDNGRDAENYFSAGSEGNGGAGGGYRGGINPKNVGKSTDAGGSGGSSYISGHFECEKLQGYTFNNIEIKNGNSYFNSPSGNQEQGHLGDGFARITVLSTTRCTASCKPRHTIYTYISLIVLSNC